MYQVLVLETRNPRLLECDDILIAGRSLRSIYGSS